MIFKAFDNPQVTAAGFIDYLDKAVGVKNLLQAQLASQVQQSQDSLSKLQATASRRKDIRAMVLGKEPEKTTAAVAADPQFDKFAAWARRRQISAGFQMEDVTSFFGAAEPAQAALNKWLQEGRLEMNGSGDDALYSIKSQAIPVTAMKPEGFVTENAAGGYDAHTADGKKVASGAASPAAAAAHLREEKTVSAALLGDLYEACRNLQDWCHVYGTPTVIERAASIRDNATKILVAEKVETPKLLTAAQRFSGDKATARRAISTIKACVEQMNGLGKLNAETQRNANRLLESAISIEFNIGRM